MTAHHRENTIEHYVRSLAPQTAIKPQLERIERFEALSDRGVVSEYSIHVVGCGIVHEGNYESAPMAERLRDRLAEIEEWASATGATVPGIRTTTVSETCFNEMRYTVTKFPHNLVLEYANDQLRFCSPSVVDGKQFSVDDHIADLRATADRSERTRAVGTQQ